MVNANPEDLIDSKQLFHFVSADLFNDTLADPHLLKCLFDTANQYKDEVVKMIKICLIKFHQGFDLQKGSIFNFGSTKNDDTGTVLKISSVEDASKLSNVPVHNLSEERSVGMLNYELDIRGKDNFSTGSQNLVINKSCELICTKFDKYKNFKQEAQDIRALKLKWNEKMSALEKEGLSLKETANLTEEAKKLKDLQYLKEQVPQGPFSSGKEVENFMEDATISEEEKKERLYREVRFAKTSATCIKKSSAIFRLKQNYKLLEAEDYAHNLKLYFGCISSVKTISLKDFSYILTGLNAASTETLKAKVKKSKGNKPKPKKVSEEEVLDECERDGNINLQPGSHVAAVWADDFDAAGKKLTWHIGVVESLNVDSVKVSYLMQSSSKSKSTWIFPETASTFITPVDQIISSDINIEYSCATIIRSRISVETINMLDNLLKEYVENLSQKH